MSRRSRRLFDSLLNALNVSVTQPSGYRFAPKLQPLETRDVPTSYPVSNLNDSGAGSLRQAIIDANANSGADTIDFQGGAAGTIVLLTALPTITDNVAINGQGASTNTVQRSGSAAAFGIFTVNVPTVVGAVSFTGLTITGGSGTTGSGIYITTNTTGSTNTDSVTVTNSVITGNTPSAGVGGIFVGTSGTLTVTGSTISNNTVTGNSGGIYASSSASITVVNSAITGNTSSAKGGGIYFVSSGSLNVTGSTISGNTANSTSTSYSGGGISFYGTVGAAGFNIVNSTIHGNTSAGTGGGVAIRQLTGTANIQNSTITGNTAGTAAAAVGGGVAMSTGTGTVNIANTVIAGNKAGPGGANNDLTRVGTTASLIANNTFFGTGEGVTITSGGGNNTSGTNASPTDPLLGALANNGGPTFTRLPQTGSPLLDAGNNGLVPSGVTTDQRGGSNPRISGGAVDIGSVEIKVNNPTATATAANVTTAGGTTYTFTVTYTATSPALINVSTLGTGDVTVSGPNSFSATPTFVSATPSANAGTVTATYQFTAPGGTFGVEDNGSYTITTVANQVSDTASTPLPVLPGAVGSFAVAIPLNIVVTNTNDTGAGSLRQAILDTNAAGTADTITFQSGLTGTITLATALTITDAVTITGPGIANLTITGNSAVRVFDTSGAPASTPINISGVKITGGAAATGAGILVGDEFLNLNNVAISGNAATSQGGGIYVTSVGFVQLANSTVSGNTSTANGGGIYFNSGGAFNIVNSTISGNTSGGTGIGGGGVYFYGTVAAAVPTGFTASTLTLTNSTISGNTSPTSGGGIVLNTFTGALLVQSSTIAENTANGTGSTQGGGGIARLAGTGTVTLKNTVVAQNTTANSTNTNGDVFLSTTTGAFNADYSFIGNQTGLTIVGGNNLSGNAQLGSLGNNGGPTQTYAPQSGSPLLNAGSSALVPSGLTSDQRGPGYPRIYGSAVDIGAFEFSVANAAPQVATSSGNTSYTENGSAVVIDAAVTVTDADNTTLASAKVSITGGFAGAEDVLGFTNQNGISGSYNASTGVLTLTGTATVAQYQSALQSVTYVNTSDSPSTTNRTITFTANDGTVDSAAATKTVTVAAVNDAPQVTTSGGSTAYAENAAATVIDAGVTVTDLDNATLAGAKVSITGGFAGAEDVLGFTNQNGISGSYNASTGVLTLTGSASVANYQLALRSVTYFNSSDSPSTANRTITFTANDGTVDSAAATKTVTVAAVNDAPQVTTSGGSTAYAENAAATVIDAGVTVTDLDNATLAGAKVSITGGFAGAEDVLGFTNQNGISGSYNASTGVLTLTGSASVANYQLALRSVTYFNSSDSPSTANRTITFTANDGTVDSAAATKTVTVAAVNDAPQVTTSGGSTAYAENAAATVIDAGVTVTDLDNATLAGAKVSITGGFAGAEDVLGFTNQNGISGSYNASTGVLTLTGSASVANYQLALRSVTYFNSSDSPSTANRTITFTANDGTVDSAAATKTVTVAAVNDAPQVTTSGGSTAYAENAAATVIDAGVTVTDLDNATLAGAKVSITGGFAGAEDVLGFTNQNGISGSYNASTGVLTLTGSASVANYQLALRSVTYFNSSDSPSTTNRTITFTANDGTVDSAAATKTVTVAAVNDAPVNTVPGTQTVVINTTTPIPGISVTDADAGAGNVTVTASVPAGSGTFSGTGFTSGSGTNSISVTGTLAAVNTALGTLQYTAPASPASVTVTVLTSDNGNTGGSAQSDTDQFLITVSASAPTAAPTVTSPAAPTAVNTANFNITGTAIANSLVKVYRDVNNNGAIDAGDTVVAQQQLTGGATSFSISTPLTSNAANNFVVTATASPATESTPTDVPTITQDSIAPALPVVTSPAAPTTVNATTFAITGTAEANSLVKVFLDANNDGVADTPGTPLASQQLTGGATAFSITVPLAANTANNFVVTATDAATNQSSAADVPTITQDATAPALPVVTSPAAPTSVNATTFAVTGTAEANSLVKVYRDVNNNGAIDAGDAVVGSQQLTGGATAFSITVPLTANAANNFVVTATDAAANASAPADVPTITQDSIAPALPLVSSPAAPTTVNVATFPIIGTAEANSLVKVFLDANNDGVADTPGTPLASQQLTGGATAFSITVPLTANAANNFVVTATDAAANASAPADVPTITADSTTPAAPVVTGPAAPTTLDANTLTVTGTAEANSLVKVYSDLNNNGAIDAGDAVVGSQQLTGGATAFSITVPLTANAANNFVVTATDAAANASAPADVPTITADSTTPAAPVVTGPAAPTTLDANTLTVTGTAEANSLVQVYADSNNSGTIDAGDAVVGAQQLAAGQTGFSITVPLTQNEANNFVVTATDAAGNVSAPADVPTVTEAPHFIVVGSDAGTPARVRVLSATGTPLADFSPFRDVFPLGYTGGVRATLVDLTGDGVDDIIVATAGTVGYLTGYDGRTGASLGTIAPFGGLRSGLVLAAGDLDGDGRADLLIGQETGGSFVTGYSGRTLESLGTIEAFPGFAGGVRLALGDATGDGRADLAIGTGPGGNGLVQVYDGVTRKLIGSFTSAVGYPGEVSLALGDVTRDGRAEVITSIQVAGAGTQVQAFTPQGQFVRGFAAANGFGAVAGFRRVGATGSATPGVAATDLNGDGYAELLLGGAPATGGTRLMVLDGKSGEVLINQFAFDPVFDFGISVGTT